MAGTEDARPPPALPWTVRLQFAALSLAHRPDGSVRRFLFSLGDLHAAARPRPDASGSAMTTTASPSSLRLAGVVLIQPFFGGEERTEAEVTLDKVGPSLSMVVTDAYWREFLPEGATRDHPAARVCGERVELAEAFPPAMVVVGGLDLLKGWQTRYVEALRGKGKPVKVVEYPDAIHGFHAFPEIADSGKLVGDIKLFVDERRPTKSSQGLGM
uniref:Alpha/beta hydrolase fold-3 domain-containing protein n=1 Tax=Aegilops tauschii subsp. strangulata TaxID=200361 RepID=A0A453AXE0_AEGTS